MALQILEYYLLMLFLLGLLLVLIKFGDKDVKISWNKICAIVIFFPIIIFVKALVGFHDFIISLAKHEQDS